MNQHGRDFSTNAAIGSDRDANWGSVRWPMDTILTAGRLGVRPAGLEVK